MDVNFLIHTYTSHVSLSSSHYHLQESVGFNYYCLKYLVHPVRFS